MEVCRSLTKMIVVDHATLSKEELRFRLCEIKMGWCEGCPSKIQLLIRGIYFLLVVEEEVE